MTPVGRNFPERLVIQIGDLTQHMLELVGVNFPWKQRDQGQTCICACVSKWQKFGQLGCHNLNV